MIKNNKGVTLVELLIVIVVMGIIAAFAIPAVGTIIENTRRDAILADAFQVENAANLYCAQTSCSLTESLTWNQVSDYVDGIDDTYYDFVLPATSVAGDQIVATKTPNGWEVILTAVDTGMWEFVGGDVPSKSSRVHVTERPSTTP